MPAGPPASNPRRKRKRRLGLSTWTMLGLAAGIFCGIFFGEYCAPLSVVGDAFVRLLQMTVLPYVVVVLIGNLGRLTVVQRRRLAGVAGCVLLLLWAVGLWTVFALALSFPQWKTGSFYSTALAEPPPNADVLAMFIPSNIFAALADSQVSAVVLLCIAVGLALARLERRQLLIDQLELLGAALMKVSQFVTRLTPLGVWAIAASTAGTISLAEAGRLQAYLIAYTGGALFLTLVVLPYLVVVCTPIMYRQVWHVSRDAWLLAFATGKLLIVLPLLIEKTEELFAAREEQTSESAPAVDVIYPLAYSFPHVGKLLGLLFIPFASWFLGHRLDWDEYPAFLGTGLFSYFGGPLLAIPHLLDQMRLPHDMFELFLLSGVYCERLSDGLGAVHLVTFTILTTCAVTGTLRLRPAALLRYVAAMTLLGGLLVVALRAGLTHTLAYMEPRHEVIAHMQLLDRPVAAVVFRESRPNPDPLLPGESLLERVRRRGVMRVGYNEDKLPFAYFNVNDQLVGYDVNLAHVLARDLGVTLEFVRFERSELAEQLRQDHFDIVMSGLVGNLERSEQMQHTAPYLEVTMSLVVPDYRVRAFASYASIQKLDRPRIGYVDLSRDFVSRFNALIPNAELVALRSSGEYFEGRGDELDALLISAESGSAFTLLHPGYQVVVPDGPRVSLPLFYAIGRRDGGLRDLLEHWVQLKKLDGTMQENYDHWILGKSPPTNQPRWSVIRDVLGWVR
ncbi:MAG: cation:dicarboxylase symporter family transporter [Pirellulaceae bacterium]|nr:cation:dicarboxylase symporter family transporter [Pirellulaceae bacterium]